MAHDVIPVKCASSAGPQRLPAYAVSQTRLRCIGARVSTCQSWKRYSFGLGKILAIFRFLVIVENEIVLEPGHVQSFRLQAFRSEDTFEITKRLAEVMVSDDVGVLPVAPHLLSHFVQSPLNLFL